MTFLNSNEGDLLALGISEGEASELRAAFATFDDWNALEMDIYNDYDAAKTNPDKR